jgi:hypothetical protein
MASTSIETRTYTYTSQYLSQEFVFVEHAITVMVTSHKVRLFLLQDLVLAHGRDGSLRKTSKNVKNEENNRKFCGLLFLYHHHGSA